MREAVKRWLGWSVVLLAGCGAGWPAGGAVAAPAPNVAPSEIVVSMRYLQQTGVSHAHLYLYREDGKLLRQLTDDNAKQDYGPIFAPDGETIVFRRGADVDDPKPEWWSIEPRGGNLHRLDAAPEWYAGTKSPLYFTNSEEVTDAPATDATGKAKSNAPPTVRTPDGSMELVLKPDTQEEEDKEDFVPGRHYLLRDLKTGKQTELAKLPGFNGLQDLLSCKKGGSDADSFLWEGTLRLAFFDRHLNSTDGDTCYALDLTGRRIVDLSPNWAAPISLSGESAFLTLTENRYVPFGDGKRTANCSYVERWDAALKKVRYAREGAGICLGASMYRPGKTPVTVTITEPVDK